MNLWKASKSWAHLSIILGRKGANSRVLRMFFKEVVQALLIFGEDTWVMTPRMGRNLGGFQHRVFQRITWSQNQWLLNGIWEYPPLDMAMHEVGFDEMEAYVLKRQNTVAQ